MVTKRYPVWFNAKDKKRYSSLKIKTPFHVKVKELLNSFLEGRENSK